MTTQKVQPEGLEQAILETLETYSREVTQEVKAEVKTAADACAAKISSNAAAKFNGHAYANSWTQKKAYEDPFDVRYRVYSKKYYPLTQLLEFGHDKWIFGHETGEYVQGRAHIRPAADEAAEKLVRDIKMRLSR